MKRAHDDAFIDDIDAYMKDNQLESNLMDDIAKSGDIREHSWDVIRHLIELKMKQAMTDMFNERGYVGPLPQTFSGRMEELIGLLHRFQEAPPFTLQRLAELILYSSKQYSSTHKYMNGLEKVLSVSTTNL